MSKKKKHGKGKPSIRRPAPVPMTEEMERVRQATGVFVQAGRHFRADSESIREEVLDALKYAFTSQGKSAEIRVFHLIGPDGADLGEDIAPRDCFRYVLAQYGSETRQGVSPDPYREESYYAVVTRTLNELLGE